MRGGRWWRMASVLAVVWGSVCAAEEGAVAPSAGVCDRHRAEAHGAASAEAQWAAIRDEIAAYQGLVEEALAARAAAIALYAQLSARQQAKAPLTGGDLQALNQGALAMLAVREALLRASLAHECWLDDPVPTDELRARVQSAGLAMSLSAALVLYDNYLSAVSLYRANGELRRHLNRADQGFELRTGELNRISLSFASPSNRSRIRRGIRWFEQHGYGAVTDEGYRYLVELIEQSPSRNVLRRLRPAEIAGRAARFLGLVSYDTLAGLQRQGVGLTSMLFGNAVGLVESRRGKLDGQPEVLARVSEQLRAGDILLEKTPFRLTDSFIPGHWGHAAVWVGTPEDLQALGIWEHPVVRKHRERIVAGSGVVEALRSGVEINPLRRFLNIDDLAVLREQSITEAQRAEIVLQALRQVGKAYDFNFDVETTDKIVCSELVYHAYAHQVWPTARHLGRATISPDNVAARALPGGVLQLALLYHDGVEVVAEPDAVHARLLGKVAVTP